MNLASSKPKPSRSRGSALLAVLWLTAALSAIAFSVALKVRGETERVATGEEDVRAEYLAKGAIDRAILYLQWGAIPRPDGVNPYFVAGQPEMHFQFPSGYATVEVIPEASKLSLNYARPEVLENLMLALGADPQQAATIAAGIVYWRSPGASDAPAGMASTFQPAHASFQEVEDLLNLPGMTPDLFYGTWAMQGNHLAPRAGVRDCVSVYGSVNNFDANTVQPPVLAAVGVAPGEIAALVEQRREKPFLSQQELAGFASGGAGVGMHVSVTYHTIYTLRATARMRRPDGSLSDAKRVVSAMVKMLPATLSANGFHILRWYDRG